MMVHQQGGLTTSRTSTHADEEIIQHTVTRLSWEPYSSLQSRQSLPFNLTSWAALHSHIQTCDTRTFTIDRTSLTCASAVLRSRSSKAASIASAHRTGTAESEVSQPYNFSCVLEHRSVFSVQLSRAAAFQLCCPNTRRRD